jgi:catechol 2,3-dioxygenase-like lactoylglutathione lyase family enzyme
MIARDRAMIKGMNHVGISVSDLDRSIEFYRDMLGLELAGPIIPFAGALFEQVMALENPQGRIGFLSNGSLQIELFEFRHPNPAPKDPNYSVADRGISHFCVEVTDLAATYERLLAAGVRFHCPVLKFQSGIKATYARDPDGNVFELLEMSRAASSPQPDGKIYGE